MKYDRSEENLIYWGNRLIDFSNNFIKLMDEWCHNFPLSALKDIQQCKKYLQKQLHIYNKVFKTYCTKEVEFKLSDSVYTKKTINTAQQYIDLAHILLDLQEEFFKIYGDIPLSTS